MIYAATVLVVLWLTLNVAVAALFGRHQGSRARPWLVLAGFLIATNAFAAPPAPPRVYLDTTPVAPTGSVLPVPAGGSLQAALDAVQPGGVVELAAGATFSGNFVVRAKATTNSLWITIRSSGSALPARDTRVAPSNAPAMAKIVSPNASTTLTFENGSRFFRLVGLEITTTHAVTSSTHYGLVFLGMGLSSTDVTTSLGLPSDIVFDRCYIHGTPKGNVRRGILMNSARTAVVDSYLADFHEVGADSQAVLSYNGSGPFALVNNYLEAAGENVLFGGSDPAIANLVPSDIEIRGNTFAKPLKWKLGDPSYAGIRWSVKNIFELKNAQRVLILGNTFENNWSDSQNGFSILFTPRNQNGTAPWSIVADVRFENNVVRHVTQGFNVLGHDSPNASQQTARILVRNNLLYDVSETFVQVLDGVADLVVEHNTAMQGGKILSMDGGVNSGFEFRDNITPHNAYGIFGSNYGSGNAAIAHYFPGTVLRKNVLIGAAASSYSQHPDNFFPSSIAAVGFTNPGGNGYRLLPTSAYRDAATDGTDVGVAFAGTPPAPSPTAAPPAGVQVVWTDTCPPGRVVQCVPITPVPVPTATKAPPSPTAAPPTATATASSSPTPSPSSGATVNVSNEAQLQAAVAALAPNSTIVIAAGTYDLTRTLYLPQGVSNVTIKGGTGNRDDVILKGQGMAGALTFGFWIGGVRNATLADLTIRDFSQHGIIINQGAQAPRLSNLHIVDIGTQFIKVNPMGVNNGILENSLIEYSTVAPTDYTNGIDVHNGAGWVVRGNTFRNIRAAGSLAGPAVLFWNASADTVVEKNVFVDNQRDISLGLDPGKPGQAPVSNPALTDHARGVITNNFIVRTMSIPRADVPIAVFDSPQTKVYFNTVLTNGTYPNAIEYRFARAAGVDIKNNLAEGNIVARDGATAVRSNNLTTAAAGMVVNAATGDLHLSPSGQSVAVGKGIAVSVKDDIDGQARPSTPDLGADQVGGT